MDDVGFFTPISYGSIQRSKSQERLEAVDSYLSLSGRKAQVVPGWNIGKSEGTILIQEETSWGRTALKVLSYCTIILPLIALIAKASLRAPYHFHQIDVRGELEKGIEITEGMKAALQCEKETIYGEPVDSEKVKWEKRFSCNLRTFALTTEPNLIFTMVSPGYTYPKDSRKLTEADIAEGYVASRVRARETCILHDLDLLEIPKLKKFELDGHIFIAEQRSLHEKQDQEQFYEAYAKDDKDDEALAALELTTFIAKTGFRVDETTVLCNPDKAHPFTILDQGSLASRDKIPQRAAMGISGSKAFSESCGLIRCLRSEKQIDAVIAKAAKLGI